MGLFGHNYKKNKVDVPNEVKTETADDEKYVLRTAEEVPKLLLSKIRTLFGIIKSCHKIRETYQQSWYISRNGKSICRFLEPVKEMILCM